jgi:hypothetical protein
MLLAQELSPVLLLTETNFESNLIAIRIQFSSCLVKIPELDTTLVNSPKSLASRGGLDIISTLY